MGLFNNILDVTGLGSIFGVKSSAEKAAEKASGESLGFQQQGLDYLKETQALPLELRDKALTGLSDFYMGEGQQDFVDRAKASPFYESMIDQGRQGVGAALSATGNIRGGAGPTAFYQQDQNVLQNLVGQQLQGFQGLAQQPINAGQVAQQYSNMGATKAAGTTASAQAKQDQFGQLLNLGFKAGGMFI